MGSFKKHRTIFCDKPVCVCSTRAMHEGAKTEDSKGLRERNMSLYSV